MNHLPIAQEAADSGPHVPRYRIADPQHLACVSLSHWKVLSDWSEPPGQVAGDYLAPKTGHLCLSSTAATQSTCPACQVRLEYHLHHLFIRKPRLAHVTLFPEGRLSSNSWSEKPDAGQAIRNRFGRITICSSTRNHSWLIRRFLNRRWRTLALVQTKGTAFSL
jgi:hypothetical protein